MIIIPLNIQRFADGKVVIDTDLDKKGFESGLNKIQSIAKTGFKAVATSVGVAATAITALVGKSVQAAGELEQQVGGAEAVFKSLGKTIEDIKFTSFKDAEGNVMSLKQVANDAYKTMGLSANDYLATINKMGALMQGSGLDTQKAMDLSGQAMQRAADVASIMGIDINSAMESIAGAAKGNFTMMDNLGVAMNATTIEAYALSKGIKTSYNEMTNAQKVELAMQMFLEKSAYATGNYVKENETFAGSFTTLKASIQNFLSGVGDIESVIDSVMSFGKILVKSIGEMAPRIVEGIVKLINGIIPQLPPLLQKLLPVVIKGAVDLVNGVVKSLPTLLPILINGIIDVFTEIVKILPQISKSLIDGVLLIINEIAKQLPTLIPLIIDTMLKMYETIIDNIDLFIDAAIQLIIGLSEGLIQALPILIEKIPILIDKLVTKLTDSDMLEKLIKSGIKLNLKLAEGLIKAIPQLVAMIPKIINSLVNGIKAYFGTIKNLGIELLNRFINGINNKIGSLSNKANEIVNTVINKIRQLPSNMISWGRDMIQGLINGITSKIGAVANAVKGVANKIKSFLHFSRPDEGPLREYEEWMPDMIKGLAESMKKNSYILSNESKNLAQKIKDSMDLNGIYDDMQNAINVETSKVGASVEVSGANRSIQNMLSASATFEGIIPLQVDLDGEKIYDNQQKISARKNLQYGGVR